MSGQTRKGRYLVTAAFTVETPNGPRTFQPGAVLSIVQEKAAPLIMGGKLREVAPDPDGNTRPAPDGGRLLPWRTATGRLIYLAESTEAAAQAPAGAATFQGRELDLSRGATTATINLIIDCKEVFNGTIEQGEEPCKDHPTRDHGTRPPGYRKRGAATVTQ